MTSLEFLDRGGDAVWREAWEWLRRAHDGEFSEEDESALQAWLADPTHRQRYDEAKRLWTDASLVQPRYLDADPDVPLDLDALRKAFHCQDGSS